MKPSEQDSSGLAMSQSNEIEDLLNRWQSGEEEARTDLLEVVYTELHRLARSEMARQRASHTLQPTALVHEAFLRLCGKSDWVDRNHFLRLSASAMRHILVDHARRKAACKRTEPGDRVELDSLVEEYDRRSGGLVEIDAALERLKERDPELVKLVELRFFVGHTMEEVAAILGIPTRTAARRWQVARAFLKGQLEP